MDDDPAPPTAARFAAMVWMAYGVLFSFLAIIGTVYVVSLAITDGGDRVYYSIIGVLVGCQWYCVLFFLGGWRVYRGYASEVDGPAIVALIFGIPALLAGAGIGVVEFFLPVPGMSLHRFMIGGFLFSTGAMLTVSGLLALSVRGKYKIWREEHQTAQNE